MRIFSYTFPLTVLVSMSLAACASQTGTSDNTNSSGNGNNNSGNNSNNNQSSSGSTHSNGSNQSSNGSSGGNNTGSNNTSSSSDNGSTTSTTAAWNQPTPANSTGQFPFPQNRTVSQCTYPSTAPSNLNPLITQTYTKWKAQLLTTAGAGNGARVQDPQTSNRTVSEGIGYGMLIAVYMADKTTFDQLWTYEQSHTDGHGLMNWEIDSSGGTQGGGSATDADQDMAWALLMAAKQWPSGGYSGTATTQISNIAGSENGGSFPGVGDNGSAGRYYDYFSPAYYGSFGSGFSNNVTTGYGVFSSNKSGTGNLLPDCAGGTNGCSTTSTFGYDACRIPWRIGVDYCMNNSTSASQFLGPMVTFLVGKGVTGLKLPMNLDGSLASGAAPSGAIVGPAGVAAMSNSGDQSFITSAFTNAFTQANALDANGHLQYFGSSLALLSMLEMSGNFFDYANPPQ